MIGAALGMIGPGRELGRAGARDALPQLQRLQLRGTGTTEAGIQEFQKALPQVKVER